MSNTFKDYKTKELSPKQKKEWDAFVDISSNGTLFHKQRFLDYHKKGRFDFRHLMVYWKDKLVSVIPGALYGNTFKSPAGASFGGFVVKKNIGIEEADGIIKSFIIYCGQNGIKDAYLTPPMQIYHETFNEAMEYSMNYNHFVQISSLYSSVIDFSKIHDKKDLSQNTRHKINRAINKGVEIKETKDFDAFYPILLKNKEKFEVRPTHSLQELKKIDKLLPGKMVLFMAYHGGKPIGGQLLFVANKTCVLNFYTMHLYEHRNLFPVNYLIDHSIRWCNEKGFKYYDYGVSADTFSNDPMEPSWSLIQFKESMGANGCQRKTYYRRIF